jgi:hypothetical protein
MLKALKMAKVSEEQLREILEQVRREYNYYITVYQLLK